jgi:hypothetical protein
VRAFLTTALAAEVPPTLTFLGHGSMITNLLRRNQYEATKISVTITVAGLWRGNKQSRNMSTL